MAIVVLAEKPKQAQAYASAFRECKREQGYYSVKDSLFGEEECFIMYAIGHLVSLASPEKYGEVYAKWSLENLPILPEKFKYEVTSDKEIQFNVIEKLVKKARTIVIATDCDREGENIAWSILNQMELKKEEKIIRRLWINSLENDVIYGSYVNTPNKKSRKNCLILVKNNN